MKMLILRKMSKIDLFKDICFLLFILCPRNIGDINRYLLFTYSSSIKTQHEIHTIHHKYPNNNIKLSN